MLALQDSQLLAKSKDLKQQAAPQKRLLMTAKRDRISRVMAVFLITEMDYGSAILLISKVHGIVARHSLKCCCRGLKGNTSRADRCVLVKGCGFFESYAAHS
jgi:hypothetical protein